MCQVFRQYAFIANLFRKTFPVPKDTIDKREASKSSDVPESGSQELGIFTCKEEIITLSNEDPNEDNLNFLLNTGFPGPQDDASPFSKGSPSSNQMHLHDVKVDVTLRPHLEKPPALMLLITDPGQRAKQSGDTPVRVSIWFEIGLNGHVTVVETSGLIEASGEKQGDTEMQGTDETASKLQDLQKRIARVLETSQDLGILVEWVLRWLRQRDGSG